MKSLKILSACAALTLPLSAASAESISHQENQTEVAWGLIDSQGLKALLDAKTPLTLLDARTDKWFDGTLILGAQRLPYDAPGQVVEKVIPSKQKLVVVYCAGEGCDASQKLAKRLVSEGYSSVVDYHGGIKDWTANNYPTQTVK